MELSRFNSRMWAMALCVATAFASGGCQALVWTDWGHSVRPSPREGRTPPPDLSAAGVSAAPGQRIELTLSLDQAAAVAAANNPQIRMAVEEIEKARGDEMTAWSSMLPTADLNLGYTRLELSYFTMSIPGGPPVKIKMGVRDNYKAELGVKLPLFVGGAGFNGIELASLARDYAELKIEAALMQAACMARKTYIDVLFAAEAVAVHEQGLVNAEAHLADVKKKLEHKVGTRFDVLRAEVRVANARASLIQGRSGLNLARAALLRVLGLPQDSKLTLSDGLSYVPVKVSEQASLDGALSRRRDLKQAMLAVEMQEKKLSMTKGGILPQAFGFFNWGWSKPSSKSMGSADGDDYWNAGLMINVPLFDGFATLGKIRKDYAILRQARWWVEDARQQIALEVKQAATALADAMEFVESQKENVKQAEESLRLVKVAFEAGTATQLDMLDVQTALTGAKLNYLQAVYGFMAAKIALEQAEAAVEIRLPGGMRRSSESEENK